MFTGSGFPMRFADTRRLADRRLPGGDADHRRVGDRHRRAHPGAARRRARRRTATTASSRPTCTPTTPTTPGADAIVAEAQARGVPVVSAAQMLDWLDGRNDSSFGGPQLQRQPAAASRSSRDAARAAWRRCSRSTGRPATLSTAHAQRRGGRHRDRRIVKGIDYRVFDAVAGSYVATYGPPVDDTPPETTITAARSAATAPASRSRPTSPARQFECRLDGGPFVGCAAPRQFTGLAAGQHIIEVRATAGSRTDSTPAARGFTIASATPGGGGGAPPVGGGESGGPGTQPGGGVLGEQADRSRPHVVVLTRRARSSTAGVVTLRATCPATERRCRVRLRLRLGERYIGSRTLAVTGGETKRFRIQLKRSARTEAGCRRVAAGHRGGRRPRRRGQRRHGAQDRANPRAEGALTYECRERRVADPSTTKGDRDVEQIEGEGGGHGSRRRCRRRSVRSRDGRRRHGDPHRRHRGRLHGRDSERHHRPRERTRRRGWRSRRTIELDVRRRRSRAADRLDGDGLGTTRWRPRPFRRATLDLWTPPAPIATRTPARALVLSFVADLGAAPTSRPPMSGSGRTSLSSPGRSSAPAAGRRRQGF